MILARGLIIGLWIFFTLFATSSSAEEQRCKELGANCVCSEPLNTNTYISRGDSWQDPADSTTKECQQTSSLAGSFVERNSKDIFGTNNPTILGRLPADHSVNFVARAPNNHRGIWSMGNGTNWGDQRGWGQYRARVAARWYVYHSAGDEGDGALPHEFYEKACTNNKFAQLRYISPKGDLISDQLNTSGKINFRSFFTSEWTGVAKDGTGISSCPYTGPTLSDWRGKWWRVEYVFSNLDGPGFDLKIYLKNITDNEPEITVVDLERNCGSWIANPDLSPLYMIRGFFVNFFRASNSSTPKCEGFKAISHFMMAGWDTNEGQRIGGAVEIEGALTTTKDTTPPSSPVIYLKSE